MDENNDYFKHILQDINNNQALILTKIYQHLNENIFIFDDIKRKNRIKMIGLLYAVYLSTLSNLETKVIIDDDLTIFYYIYNDHKNYDTIINFKNSVQSLEKLYSKLKEQKKENQNPNNSINPKLNIINDYNNYNSLFLDQRKTELFKAKKRNEEKPKMTNCIFCLENFNQNEIVNPILECKNHIHGKCLINYIETELNNNHFPIKCPICQNNQRHEINYKILLDSLLLNDKDNLAKKLETISLNHLAQTNPEIVTFCPTPGCSYMCFFDKASYHLNCPLCMKSYCLKCKTEWHDNLTCEQYQYQKNKKAEEFINAQKFDNIFVGITVNNVHNAKDG